MVAGNGKGTIITREQELSEFKTNQRRLRKPTIGEIEDAMNDFAQKMLSQYGPLAVAVREMKLDFDARLKRLESTGGDTE